MIGAKAMERRMKFVIIPESAFVNIPFMESAANTTDNNTVVSFYSWYILAFCLNADMVNNEIIIFQLWQFLLGLPQRMITNSS